MLEISRERVRQLERDALERLRGAAERTGTPA
jgi:DNA-directed RNA polymerase sigma subunit (sigma70/sigma32)